MLPSMLDPQPCNDDSLPLVEPPFLPKATPYQYTLVLDLDETLVHYYETEEEGHILVRPGCENFLNEMAKSYEIVVFTAAMQDVKV
jgi:TFIIF-interacting CTD phosphatase-like protein